MNKINIIKKIDKYLVGSLIRILPKAKNASNEIQPDRILLIKTIAIGDLVVLLPTIKAIKELFPHSKISLLTTPRVKEVVEGFQYLDEIIYYDILGEDKGIKGLISVVRRIKEGRFGLSIDFEHYYNFTALICRLAKIRKMAGLSIDNQVRNRLFSFKIPYDIQKHEVEAFYDVARYFGASDKDLKLQKIATSNDDAKKVNKFLLSKRINQNDLLVGIHAMTSDSAKARRWEVKKFAAVADSLIKQYDAKIILTGTNDDYKMMRAIAAKMKHRPIFWKSDSSLKEFAKLCERLNLFISLDTGPMHLAAAMGTKTIGLFGPNTPEKWGAYGYSDLAIYNKLECSPCTKQYLGQISKCKTGDCMKAINVGQVMEKVKISLNLAESYQPKIIH